ncbi:MAG TPA: hypothetical protein DDZ83_00520, partial [Nitrospinae bacterium]|nr:hypothetical protein [Nitrospinota bacterium]
IKSKLNKIEVALTREREALKRIQKNQKEGEVALARESEALRRLRKKQKEGEAALARERSSASQHRADLGRLRAALAGTSSTAKESRQKLAAAKGMLAEMEESRRRVEERALLLSTKVQSETRRARKLERDVADLSRKLASQQITLRRTKKMLRIDIIDRILFDVGQARIKEEGLAALDRIVAFIKKYPGRATRVEGHTDNMPISGALARRYPTNWELSAARAIRVVRHLQSKGVPPGRLSATARSFYRPVVSNDSAAGRSKNRRIVILMSSPALGK